MATTACLNAQQQPDASLHRTMLHATASCGAIESNLMEAAACSSSKRQVVAMLQPYMYMYMHYTHRCQGLTQGLALATK